MVRLACLFITVFSLAIMQHESRAGEVRVFGKEDRAQAIRVWNRYAECLKTRRFAPCYNLLSARVKKIWQRDHSATTSHRYGKIKADEEIIFTKLQLTGTEVQGPHIVVRARANGFGEGGSSFTISQAFFFVKEPEGWRIDKMTNGVRDYLP